MPANIFSAESDMVPIILTADHRKAFSFLGLNNTTPSFPVTQSPTGDSSAYILNLPTEFNPYATPSMAIVPMESTPIDPASLLFPSMDLNNSLMQTIPSGAESTASFLQQLLSWSPDASPSFGLDPLLTPISPPTDMFNFEDTSYLSSPPSTPNLFVEETTRPLQKRQSSTTSVSSQRSSRYYNDTKKAPGRRGRKPNPNTIVEVIPPPPPTLPPNTVGFINIVFDPITDDIPDDGIPEFKEVHDEANPQVGDGEEHPARSPLLTGIPLPQPTKLVFTVFPKPSQRMLRD
ncbi:hypothetical protein HDU67_009098 [Dinochytrium kinnereticum]|nr:hypothetical protein HDU67_009098 [Dinochytrium kinnereticum]